MMIKDIYVHVYWPHFGPYIIIGGLAPVDASYPPSLASVPTPGACSTPPPSQIHYLSSNNINNKKLNNDNWDHVWSLKFH